MSDLIFGHTWEEIKKAQQGLGLARNLPPVDVSQACLVIQQDVQRFKIPVAESVVKAYGIVLPEGYVLEGDKYVFKGGV